MNRVVLGVGLAVVLPLIGVLFVNLDRQPGSIESPLVGRPAPTFRLSRVGDGSLVDLAALRGRPVVVNFWATWCVPCYQEHAVLVRAAAERGDEVAFVGIVYEDEEPRVRRFLAERGDAYPAVMDDAGKTAIAYGVYGVPETFFVDAAGVIAAKFTGPLGPNALDAHLALAGAEPRPRLRLR